jgi:hypothetical protein
MTAPIKPQKVQANGKDSWWFVTAIADMTAPTAAEVNAGTGLNISCYLLAEQEGVTSNAEKVRLARLLCETTTTEGLGEQTFSLADIQGVFDPQAASGADGKKAWEKFKDGASGYLVRRQAVVATTGDAVAGQFVDVFKVDVGQAVPGKTANDASGIYSFTAPVALLDQKFNRAVAA